MRTKKYLLLLIILSLKTSWAYSQHDDSFYFEKFKIRGLCEVSKYLFNVKGYQQIAYDRLACKDCNSCQSNWEEFEKSGTWQYNEKQIVLGLYTKNYDDYGANNTLAFKIDRFIAEVKQTFNEEESEDEIQIKKTNRLLSTLYSVKQGVLNDKKSELQKIITDKNAKTADSLKQVKQAEIDAQKSVDPIPNAQNSEENESSDYVRKIIGIILTVIIHLFIVIGIILYIWTIVSFCREFDTLYRAASIILGLLLGFGAYYANTSLYDFMLKSIDFKNSFSVLMVIIVGFSSGLALVVAVSKAINIDSVYVPYIMLVLAPIVLLYFLDMYARTSFLLKPEFLTPNVSFVAGLLYKIIFNKDRLRNLTR